MLHHLMTLETAGAHAVTQHNIVFEGRVMGGARDAILQGMFPDYLCNFFAKYYGDDGYPRWCVDALRSVDVDLLQSIEHPKVVDEKGAKWEYADAS